MLNLRSKICMTVWLLPLFFLIFQVSAEDPAAETKPDESPSQSTQIPDGWHLEVIRELSFYIPDLWEKLPEEEGAGWYTRAEGRPGALVSIIPDANMEEILDGFEIEQKKSIRLGARMATWAFGQVEDAPIKGYCIVMDDPETDGSHLALIAVAPDCLLWASSG